MNKTFSAQMLKTVKECPYKYYLEYEKKIKIPQDSSFAQTGKNMHALINYYLKGFDTNKLEKALSKEEKKIWQNFLKLEINKNNIFQSEYGFNVKIDNENWLTGRIDAITKKDNIYTIYDWKTGTLPKNPEEDLQTLIYLFALNKILKNSQLIKDSEMLRFVYLNLKTSESADVFIPNKTLEAIDKTICTIIKELQEFLKMNYYPKDSNPENSTQNSTKKSQCKTCKFKTICGTDVFL